MDIISGVIAPALGVALNPFPIIAIILVLASDRARSGGLALLAGWSGGISVAVGLLVVVANLGGLGPNEESTPRWLSWLKLAVGILLLVLAARKWMGRPRGDEPAKLPGWLAAIPERTPAGLARFGALLGGANPKNLMFSLIASASIAGSGASVSGEIALWLVYLFVASATVLLPVLWYLLAPESAIPVLDSVRGWLVRYNVAILAAMLAIIGLLQVANGLEGLR